MNAGADIPAAGVREFEHSGDVGLEVWGDTPAQLLSNATRGLCGLMTWSRVEPAAARHLEVRAETLADLLVDWLSAVILLASTHAELYASADVEVGDDGVARGTLQGAPVDAARHELRFDVKAATYHGVQVDRTGAGYHARVVFDL
ncbi:MAG TPA: archease [Candidatus Krumholzibacteria bacterium]|nr:archease [Candidatus Krumholzibacteria bacterium]